MKATLVTRKLLTLVKSCIFIALATISFNAFADDTMYVGNPSRLNTIWVPGHCKHGEWVNGYYIKIDHNMPVKKAHMIWIGDQYDKCGNFVPGHWYFKPWYKYGYWHKHHFHYYRTYCHG